MYIDLEVGDGLTDHEAPHAFGMCTHKSDRADAPGFQRPFICLKLEDTPDTHKRCALGVSIRAWDSVLTNDRSTTVTGYNHRTRC